MTTKGKLLLVDDDEGFLSLLKMRLESEGFDVDAVNSGQQCLQRLERKLPDVLISDLRMDGMDGLELFGNIQKRFPYLPVIIITAHGSIPEAVTATQQGVFSFISKPIDKDALFKEIDKALKSVGRSSEPLHSLGSWSENIVTRSPKMIEILKQAQLVAGSDVSVLILGESGTGKEMLAEALHKCSPRHDKPFIPLNCGALPEQLLESELFGHAKGSFTGALKNHAGLFLEANGGTIFLDEIGDMPLPLQVKLLRVLQERKIRPVGSTESVDIDVRVISATHRDLEKAISDKIFREDLYYRLNVISLELPTLQERREDIALLANCFLQQVIKRRKTIVKSFSPGTLDLLVKADWPGNVRQLFNVVERLVVLSTSAVIPIHLVNQAIKIEEKETIPLNQARSEFEKDYLVQILKTTRGNVSRAARLAKRNRTDFYKLMARHSIEPNRFKSLDLTSV